MRVPVSHLFAWPVILALATHALLALGYASRRRRGVRSSPWRRERLYRCGECGRVYVDRRNVPVASCPQCGALNESVRR